MDAAAFDALSRVFSAHGTRRRLLGLAATLPLLGGVSAWLDAEEGDAKERRRRRKQRHKKRKRPGNRKHGCKPQGKAKTCAGTCGPIKNRLTCGKTVDCGSCACPAPCGECHICQSGPNTPGACGPDPEQVGEPCGSAGQVCASDGACACTTSSCPACEECGGDGVCTGCSGCCDGETCVATCPACTRCDAGQCLPCPGCCDGSGACQDGDTNAACGTGGGVCDSCTAPETCGGGQDAGLCGCTPTTCAAESKDCGQIADGCGVTLDCGTCGGDTPICISNVCKGCSATRLCPSGQFCQTDGSCVESCTVCQTSSAGLCVDIASLNHNCVSPCPTGEWCDAGACALIEATVTIPECQSVCDGTAVVCGRTVTCPDCDSCEPQTGCYFASNLPDGPVGPAYYCGYADGSLLCTTNTECASSSPWSYCNSRGLCTRICPYDA